MPTPRPVIDRVERELDRMTHRLAADLRGARGDAGKEEAALRAALSAFGAAKARMGAPATEGALSFFAVDGIGHRKPRIPALTAAKGTAPDTARWRKMLERMIAGEKPPKKSRASGAARARGPRKPARTRR
jgi:hypothetical protein